MNKQNPAFKKTEQQLPEILHVGAG